MRRPGLVISVTLGLAVAVSLVWLFAQPKLHAFADEIAPRNAAVIHALENNDFGFAYATDADLEFFAREFLWLKEQPTETQRVLRLVEWINDNIAEEEIYSVWARDVYERRAAACEVHALAVAVLTAIDIPARWISTVTISSGFGLLEAYVDGQWRLFVLRDKQRMELHQSAWDLYTSSEPGLSIRLFFSKPGQNTRSFAGSVYPNLFFAHNASERPKMQVIFQSKEGLHIDPEVFEIHEMLVGFRLEAENPWAQNKEVIGKFSWLRRQSANRWAVRAASWVRRLGWLDFDAEPMLQAERRQTSSLRPGQSLGQGSEG